MSNSTAIVHNTLLNRSVALTAINFNSNGLIKSYDDENGNEWNADELEINTPVIQEDLFTPRNKDRFVYGCW